MITTAQSLIERVLDLLPDHREAANGSYSARCPAHEDRHASLSVSVGDNGKVLLNCHAGCEAKTVVEKLGLKMADLFPPRDTNGRGHAHQNATAKPPMSYPTAAAAITALERHRGKCAGTWSYVNAQGEPVGAVLRWTKSDGTKDIFPLAKIGDQWFVKAMPTPRPLYHLPELPKAERVVIVEGEKCCDQARALGFIATTSAGGAKAVQFTDWSPLAGKQVLILPDNDSAGRNYVSQVALTLAKLTPPAVVNIIELPGLPDGGDIVDWVQTHGDAADAESMRAEIEALAGADKTTASDNDPWEDPIPFPDEITLPPFPTNCLPSWMADYISAEALATQTPPDLAGMLILGVAGAALAKNIKVVIRPGWTEPLNIYVACALFTGERKSAVFADVLRPVQDYERQETERMAPIIAEAASEHRQLEAQLKHTESKAAKESDENERQLLKHDAKELAKQVALHVVPAVPQMTVDDCTPEAVVKAMGAQGGRILQAAPEGTLFDIAKGRYSETANFDVYLKGHAGDPLRENRVSRDGANLPEAVLSVAVAIQPDVIRGLADDPTMRARGFLGRFLYSLPASRVGGRAIASAAVPENIANKYHQHMLQLWRTEGVVDEQGKPVPVFLHFSSEADLALQEFERWIEPQLAPEGELGDMAGWANKLAGAIARLAGILHVAYAAEVGQPFTRPIGEDVVENAIVIGKDYLLAHAQAAFAVMATDKKQNDAARVIKWLVNHVNHVNGVAPFIISTRDVHAKVFGGRYQVDEVHKVFELLEKHHFIRPCGENGKPSAQRYGRGIPSPKWAVNPALSTHANGSHGSHGSH